MRNLVKTAAAVAVAMAISTAANADTQQSDVDSSVIKSILPNNVQKIVNINAQITKENNTQAQLKKHIQEQQKIVNELTPKIKDAKTVNERHSDMEGQVGIQQKTVDTLRQQSSELGKDLKEVQKLVDKYNSANALDLKKIYYTKKLMKSQINTAFTPT